MQLRTPSWVCSRWVARCDGLGFLDTRGVAIVCIITTDAGLQGKARFQQLWSDAWMVT